MADALCHPNDSAGVGISSWRVTATSLCHPGDIPLPLHLMSSGWLNWCSYILQMSYKNVIMSSRWDTLPFLSHPDEIANLEFSQHTVALQPFRTAPFLVNRAFKRWSRSALDSTKPRLWRQATRASGLFLFQMCSAIAHKVVLATKFKTQKILSFKL